MLVALLVAGCASPDAGGTAAVVDAADIGAEQVPDESGQRYRAAGTVLESPEEGPRLCLTASDSRPPTCAGIDLVGWSWDTVEAESVAGTTWGEYDVVGTWSAQTRTLTLTEPAVVDDGTAGGPPAGPDTFTTRCPEPPGGWQPVDAATATQTALERATELAWAHDGVAAVWLDRRTQEEFAQDPLRLVLNVSTTGDPAQLERGVRAVWGGALCVTAAPGRSMAELEEIQQTVMAEASEFVSSSMDTLAGEIHLEVLVATAQEQSELDARFGEGTVRLTGFLAPVD